MMRLGLLIIAIGLLVGGRDAVGSEALPRAAPADSALSYHPVLPYEMGHYSYRSKPVPVISPEEHYNAMMSAASQKNWKEVILQSQVLTSYFADSPFLSEALFCSGVAHFSLGHNDAANQKFTEYLKTAPSAKHLEEVFCYKFDIAQRFTNGEKRHLFGWKKLPQWVPADEEALALYEEIAVALPNHELGIQASFYKAALLAKRGDYEEAIRSYEQLAHRFPKHPLSVQSYAEVAQVYLAQAKKKGIDADLLELAELHCEKFQNTFPREEEKLHTARQALHQMQEAYARALYETACFYEKMGRASAAHLYYCKIVAKYPSTKHAKMAQVRLDKLHYDAANPFLNAARGQLGLR